MLAMSAIQTPTHRSALGSLSYLTNWGTHRIMLRLPRDPLDIDVATDHCVSDQVTAWTTGKFLVLDRTSQDDSGDWSTTPPPH
jgi:hypothetical protein